MPDIKFECDSKINCDGPASQVVVGHWVDLLGIMQVEHYCFWCYYDESIQPFDDTDPFMPIGVLYS